MDDIKIKLATKIGYKEYKQDKIGFYHLDPPLMGHNYILVVYRATDVGQDEYGRTTGNHYILFYPANEKGKNLSTKPLIRPIEGNNAQYVLMQDLGYQINYVNEDKKLKEQKVEMENILKKVADKFKKKKPSDPSSYKGYFDKDKNKKGGSTITTNVTDNPFDLEESSLEEEGDGGDSGQGGGGSYGSQDSVTNDGDDATFWAGKQTGKRKKMKTNGLTSMGGNKYLGEIMNSFEENENENDWWREYPEPLIKIDDRNIKYYERFSFEELVDQLKKQEQKWLNQQRYSSNIYRGGSHDNVIGASNASKEEEKNFKYLLRIVYIFSRRETENENKYLKEIMNSFEEQKVAELFEKLGYKHLYEEYKQESLKESLKVKEFNSLLKTIKEQQGPGGDTSVQNFSEDPKKYVDAAVQHVIKRGGPQMAVKQMQEFFHEGNWEGVVSVLKNILGSSSAQGYQGLFPILNYAAQQVKAELKPGEYKGDTSFKKSNPDLDKTVAMGKPDPALDKARAYDIYDDPNQPKTVREKQSKKSAKKKG